MIDSTFARNARFLVMLSALAVLSACACDAPPASSNESASAPSETPATDSPAADPTSTESPATDSSSEEISLNADEQGRAVRGYDVVAYHEEGKATVGDPAFSHSWHDLEWIFSSAENRDAFAQDPERYAPAHGGYCTFGVVLKKKLDVDPEVFLVEDGRLFLFLNPEVKEKFLADKEANLELVAVQWPEMAAESDEEPPSAGG